MTSTPDAPSDVALKIDGLVKRFRAREVLNGVNLSVPSGSVLGLLGKNGAGKTTLLKSVLGLVRADAGTVNILGEDVRELSDAAKARIGYVPQEITGYTWMRAGELLQYTGAFYPRWNRELVQKLLAEWEVDPRDRIGRMSLGTRQKLAIILALAHEPDLLILDEPAASLDPAARREFLKAVLDVASEGHRTVVFSTHITSDLERVADRVAILRGGVIAYEGELDTLKDSVKRLHVTAAAPIAQPFDVPGAVRVRVEGNEAMVSVRHASPQLIDEIERQHGASVRVEDLNLEEIFLEVQHAAAQ